MAECRDCACPVLWAYDSRLGLIAVDAAPHPHGPWVLETDSERTKLVPYKWHTHGKAPRYREHAMRCGARVFRRAGA